MDLPLYLYKEVSYYTDGVLGIKKLENPGLSVQICFIVVTAAVMGQI